MSHPNSNSSRIFLGNLASEKTSKEELIQIFSKYGRIVEDIVMRKSFGFIQFDNPASATAAMRGENGRVIGGLRIDINLADSRDPKKGAPREKESGRRRGRSPEPNEFNSRKRRLADRADDQQDYARRVEQIIMREVGSFKIESFLVERRAVPDRLSQAQRAGIRYVCLINRNNETRNTTTLHILRPGDDEEFPDIRTGEAAEKIGKEEQRIVAQYASLLSQANLSQGGFPPQMYPGARMGPTVPTGYGGPMNFPQSSQGAPQQSYGSQSSQPFLSPDSQQYASAQALLSSLAQSQGYLQPGSLGTQSSQYAPTTPAAQFPQGSQHSQAQMFPQSLSSIQSYSPANPSLSQPGNQSTLGGSTQGYVPQSSQAPYPPSSSTQGTQGLQSLSSLLSPRNTEMLQAMLSKISPQVPQNVPQGPQVSTTPYYYGSKQTDPSQQMLSEQASLQANLNALMQKNKQTTSPSFPSYVPPDPSQRYLPGNNQMYRP